MPVTDLGKGAATSRTQRFVLASDDPAVSALGAKADEPAKVSLTDATEVALLKLLVIQQQELLAVLDVAVLELARLRVGIGMLTTDLERAIPE